MLALEKKGHKIFVAFYMFDKDTLLIIREQLLARSETLAVAESVTAGNLQMAFASAENASAFFQGGITAYNIGQKTRHLNVEPIEAMSCNAVSKKVADTMALNVARLFICDWGIAITGYAAPLPEQGVTDLYAHFCISYKGQCMITETVRSEKIDPHQVQLHYVNTILSTFADLLKGQSKMESMLRNGFGTS
jgi:nicotinamide-nucleotide amidase